MTQRNLAIIHYTTSDSDQALRMENRIRRAMSQGFNVVLICDAPILRRMERLTFACLNARDVAGRFAVVTEDSEQFLQAIPAVLADQMQIFATEDEAFDWIDPNPSDANGTLLLLSS